MDFADLAVIDLAKNNTPEGRAELVNDLRNALSTVGFFYVINHGWTSEQVGGVSIGIVHFAYIKYKRT